MLHNQLCQGKTCLFTSQRLSYLFNLHTRLTLFSQRFNLITDSKNWVDFVIDWTGKFCTVAETSSLHVRTNFINNVVLCFFFFRPFFIVQYNWETQVGVLNQNQMKMQQFFHNWWLFAQASACSCWASNTPEPLPSWFPEKTSCVPVRLSIKRHWAWGLAFGSHTHSFLWCPQIYKLTYL